MVIIKTKNYGLMESIFQSYKMKTKINYRSLILLLIAAGIWGFAFVAQDIAADKLPPFTITGTRSLIGFLFLFIISAVKSKIKKQPVFEQDNSKRKKLIIASIICGVCFTFAYNFQQFGIALYPDNASTSGRAGFLTGLYVLFVPLIGVIFLGKKIKLNVIIGLVFAIIGLYLLCFSNGISNVYLGDLIILICGVFFALQIIFVDKYIKDVDAIKLAAYELLVTGILSMILAIIFEKIILKDIFNAILPLLYLGLFSCAIAGMLQIIGQKLSNNATIDAIAMSFESVFAIIGGAIILHQLPLLNELIGCIFMLLAIILSQIPISLNKKVLSK